MRTKLSYLTHQEFPPKVNNDLMIITVGHPTILSEVVDSILLLGIVFFFFFLSCSFTRCKASI